MAGNPWNEWGRTLIGCACLALVGGCQSKKEPTAEVEVEKKEQAKTEPDLSSMVTMNWEDAKGVSSKSLEMPPFYRLAADQIEVLKASPDGTARRVRARGRVFIDLKDEENARVFCQEAYIWNDEMVLRGKPLLQRGQSLILGLDDTTVFYMLGTRVQVIGRHRVCDVNTAMAAVQLEKEGAKKVESWSEGPTTPSLPMVLPVMTGPWSGGPNPLLPPLSSESVPEEIREKMRAGAAPSEKIPLDLPNEEPSGLPGN